MAHAGVLTSDTDPSSKKVDSLTVLQNTELQGSLINNAIEPSKESLRFEGRNGSSDGLGGSIPDNTVTVVQWATITDPSNLEAAGIYTAASDGLYTISGHVNWAANGVGQRQLDLVVGGTIVSSQRENPAGAGVTRQNVAIVMRVLTGTTISLQVLQNSGGPLALTSGAAIFDIHMIRRI